MASALLSAGRGFAFRFAWADPIARNLNNTYTAPKAAGSAAQTTHKENREWSDVP